MDQRFLYGFQQVGIGVTNIQAAVKWYATVLLADIKVLEDNNPATYMAPYMGNQPRQKTAIILMNQHGGGGFELWQHTEHKPTSGPEVTRGDLGINCVVIYTSGLEKAKAHFRHHQVPIKTIDDKTIEITDPFGNAIRIAEKSLADKTLLTGVHECLVGVSSTQKAISFYRSFGFEVANQYREKTLQITTLNCANRATGRLGTFLGECKIQLLERTEGNPKKIYDNRFWGDPGYIHLCFDVYNLKSWVMHFDQVSPFTVLSNPDFTMGQAQGHWGYLEDPDGTLIEMVEAHYVPIIKKLGLSINLRKRSPLKPLPNWLIKAMRLKKVRF